MVLRSTQFDDVYFSADNGMAETHHVFLNGNDLPRAWQGKTQFVIAETGFGTGLNFLCTWTLFEDTAEPHQQLHFISVEKYPLSVGEIRQALSHWQADLGAYLDRYLDMYPIRVPGPHHLRLSDRVTLTLWFGDIAAILPEWHGTSVDAWFLDGFTPAKNPDMWTQNVYTHMARLSHAGTTLATFTAAGHVRRGLEKAGFAVEKCPGFGRKREMVRGCFETDEAEETHRTECSIAIIGGGLAGCAMAHAAYQVGMRVTVYESDAALAAGASGGKLGMINPKLTAKPTAHSDYYTAAYAYALRLLRGCDGVDFNRHGSLHLCTDEDKDRRFTGYINNLGWHAAHIKREGERGRQDLIYPDGATVSPQKLCHALTAGIDIRLNAEITNLDQIDADVIVIANGYAANALLAPTDSDERIPIHSVRGQVSWVKPQPGIDQNICFGGYITPQTPEGFHILGSSFQPWETDITLSDQDHDENRQRYQTATGHSIDQADIIGGWAALRTSSKDRFPVVGQVRDHIYISTAHGSHGIISSLYAAQILTAMIGRHHIPATQGVLKSLSPARFRKH